MTAIRTLSTFHSKSLSVCSGEKNVRLSAVLTVDAHNTYCSINCAAPGASQCSLRHEKSSGGDSIKVVSCQVSSRGEGATGRPPRGGRVGRGRGRGHEEQQGGVR